MKSTHLPLLLILSLFMVSCDSINKDQLYNVTWELEYISEARITFDGLYPEKKPRISFYKDSGIVEGNDSCNGYSAEFSVQENLITFGEPGPSTLMYCGNGEKVFLSTIKKVTDFNIEEGKLHLKLDGLTIMRFNKISP